MKVWLALLVVLSLARTASATLISDPQSFQTYYQNWVSPWDIYGSQFVQTFISGPGLVDDSGAVTDEPWDDFSRRWMIRLNDLASVVFSTSVSFPIRVDFLADDGHLLGGCRYADFWCGAVGSDAQIRTIAVFYPRSYPPPGFHRVHAYSPSPIPEPATLGLIGLGLAAVAARKARPRHRARTL